MKNQFFIILFLFISIACVDKKKQNNNPIPGEEEVTFIIEKLPEAHHFNNDIYISGDFEGWSGGNEKFKLKKENQLYNITIPKSQKI